MHGPDYRPATGDWPERRAPAGFFSAKIPEFLRVRLVSSFGYLDQEENRQGLAVWTFAAAARHEGPSEIGNPAGAWISKS